MPNLEKPIRMCIVCRTRYNQKKLLRLKCEDKKLVSYNNDGRSFYICEECINDTHDNTKVKRIEKAFYRECKNKDEYIVQLKEILTHVR